MFESQKLFASILFSVYGTKCWGWYLLGSKTETDYRITKGTGWLEIMVAEW
jgi:hypothetical protein